VRQNYFNHQFVV